MHRFHDEISQYQGTRIEGNAFGKMQNAIKSYFAKDKELPPEVADVVNIVSDAIKNPAAADSSPADAAIDDQQSIPSP